MLVLTAPHGEDPRDGGHVDTHPGELLYRPFTCTAGEQGDCPCGSRWEGLSSRRTSTLAEVATRTDLTPDTYAELLATFFTGVHGWTRDDADAEARALAAIAADWEPGDLLYVRGECIGKGEPQ
ncbi:DUF7715 family protein [Streptomyces sp. bgisy034]|uniref:DUF7715 family protein n=1 Tax=Streptomyces sp. bgisy034 TaxID=3413774 RepID=UPI003EBC736F